MNRRLFIVVVSFLSAQLLGAAAFSRDTANSWRTESVQSKDGTRIVFHVQGEGTPLLIVHGGWSNAAAYKPLGELLARDYRVILVERRNYGVSAAGPVPHAFTRDGEDIHAVISAVGTDCYLFGHSGGALASLHAVLQSTKGIKRLALYEPPLSVGGEPSRVVLGKYRALVADNKVEQAVTLGLIDIIGFPPDEAKWRAPLYVAHLTPALLAGAERDVEALGELNTDARQWSSLKLPVLLLQGEKSNEHPLVDSTQALKTVIADSRLVVLKGQEHSAAAMAPELVANELSTFFPR